MYQHVFPAGHIFPLQAAHAFAIAFLQGFEVAVLNADELRFVHREFHVEGKEVFHCLTRLCATVGCDDAAHASVQPFGNADQKFGQQRFF